MPPEKHAHPPYRLRGRDPGRTPCLQRLAPGRGTEQDSRPPAEGRSGTPRAPLAPAHRYPRPLAHTPSLTCGLRRICRNGVKDVPSAPCVLQVPSRARPLWRSLGGAPRFCRVGRPHVTGWPPGYRAGTASRETGARIRWCRPEGLAGSQGAAAFRDPPTPLLGLRPRPSGPRCAGSSDAPRPCTRRRGGVPVPPAGCEAEPRVPPLAPPHPTKGAGAHGHSPCQL